MSAGEIGKRIGLSRSSMFRVAYTLQHMGFVEEVPETKALKLGARVLNIGYAYLASQTLIEVARPELEALRDKTSVSSHLAILDRGEILYLSCIQTKSGFLSTMNVGTRRARIFSSASMFGPSLSRGTPWTSAPLRRNRVIARS